MTRACQAAKLAPNPIEKRLCVLSVSPHRPQRSLPPPSRRPARSRASADHVTRPAWSTGRRVQVLVPGRVTVAMTNSRGGTFMTVRVGREVYATAAVRPHDDFTFRVSNRCQLD